MRKIVLFLGIFVFVTVGYASNYTYDGKIDPIEITKWEHKYLVDIGNGFFEAGFVNPDRNAKIQVAMLLVRSGIVMAYAYIYNGEPYVFWLTNGNYGRMEFKDEKHREMFRLRILRALNGETV